MRGEWEQYGLALLAMLVYNMSKAVLHSTPGEVVGQVRKRHFLRHLYIKCIILPRQARDKHRESTQKRDVFLQGLLCSASFWNAMVNRRRTNGGVNCLRPKVYKLHLPGPIPSMLGASGLN